MSKDTMGRGVKAVWTKSKVKLFFLRGNFPYRLNWPMGQNSENLNPKQFNNCINGSKDIMDMESWGLAKRWILRRSGMSMGRVYYQRSYTIYFLILGNFIKI